MYEHLGRNPGIDGWQICQPVTINMCTSFCVFSHDPYRVLREINILSSTVLTLKKHFSSFWCDDDFFPIKFQWSSKKKIQHGASTGTQQYGSRVLKTKKWKKIQLKLLIKNWIYSSYPQASIQDVQAGTAETFSPQKRTCSTSKDEIFKLSSIFLGRFSPPGSGSGLRI